ncbi:hypothetical protein ACSVH2_09280 [Flavobacterium sp. RSB2_4_14]|uniref:hypothetical protein n=1 Tax=Flavobacterium sp. RSB2_4_14 TaxID=3447665 RepID=UPI003F2E7759
MNSAQIKLNLFRKLDSLDETKLEEAYGILMNFFNQDLVETEWNKLSIAQQQGLIDAGNELDTTNGIEHKLIIEKYKQKYA